jgi:hypothetical protein
MFFIHFVLVYMELCFVYMLILYGWNFRIFLLIIGWFGIRAKQHGGVDC